MGLRGPIFLLFQSVILHCKRSRSGRGIHDNAGNRQFRWQQRRQLWDDVVRPSSKFVSFVRYSWPWLPRQQSATFEMKLPLTSTDSHVTLLQLLQLISMGFFPEVGTSWCIVEFFVTDTALNLLPMYGTRGRLHREVWQWRNDLFARIRWSNSHGQFSASLHSWFWITFNVSFR